MKRQSLILTYCLQETNVVDENGATFLKINFLQKKKLEFLVENPRPN